MSLLTVSTMICITIPMVVLLAAWILSARSYSDREKSSPFECGFDPKSTARIPFSMRFFLLAIIFIVFDIEIVLLMPIPTLFMALSPLTTSLTSFLFLLILVAGLLHEWLEGSLDWSN